MVKKLYVMAAVSRVILVFSFSDILSNWLTPEIKSCTHLIWNFTLNQIVCTQFTICNPFLSLIGQKMSVTFINRGWHLIMFIKIPRFNFNIFNGIYCIWNGFQVHIDHLNYFSFSKQFFKINLFHKTIYSHLHIQHIFIHALCCPVVKVKDTALTSASQFMYDTS